MRKIRIDAGAETTRPGYRNGNGQMVVRATGRPSESFPGQRVYELECGRCRMRYGSNGCDVLRRLCPGCQDGARGEAVPETGPGLFDGV